MAVTVSTSGQKTVGRVGLYARSLENGRVVAFEIEARIFMIGRSKEATRKEEHGFTCGSGKSQKKLKTEKEKQAGCRL